MTSVRVITALGSPTGVDVESFSLDSHLATSLLTFRYNIDAVDLCSRESVYNLHLQDLSIFDVCKDIHTNVAVGGQVTRGRLGMCSRKCCTDTKR